MIELNLSGVAFSLAERKREGDEPAGILMVFTDPASAITVTCDFGRPEFRALLEQLRGLDLGPAEVIRPPAPKLVIPRARAK